MDQKGNKINRYKHQHNSRSQCQKNSSINFKSKGIAIGNILQADDLSSVKTFSKYYNKLLSRIFYWTDTYDIIYLGCFVILKNDKAK